MKVLVINDLRIGGFTVIPLKEIKSITQVGRTSYLKIIFNDIKKESLKINMHSSYLTFE